MLDKTKKIIYIILGTLSIISIVFMLMHKVGLCASIDTSDDPSTFDSLVPIPIGVGYGYDSNQFVIDDSWITRALELCENSSVMPYVTPSVKMIAISEYASGIGNDYVDFYAFYERNDTAYSITYNTSNSSNIRLIAANAIYVSFRYTISTDSFSTPVYQGSQTWYLSIFGNNNYCFGNSQLAGKYIFNRDIFYTHYPVYVSSDLYGDYFQYISFGGDSDFNDNVFPEYDSLPNSPSSGDSDYNLYQWLNGQNKNHYDYSKSIFDLTKGFFSWVSSPLDEDYVISSIENTTEYQVFDSVSSGVSSSFNMFENVAPAERIVIPISFANTPFSYVPDTEFNFDWYSGNVKSTIQAVLTVFMALTFLFIFLKSIPNIIQGGSNIHSLVERTGKTK